MASETIIGWISVTGATGERMPQTGAPAVTTGSSRLSRVFWMVIFSISIVLLGFRIYLAIMNGQSSTNVTVTQVIIVLFLIYMTCSFWRDSLFLRSRSSDSIKRRSKRTSAENIARARPKYVRRLPH